MLIRYSIKPLGVCSEGYSYRRLPVCGVFLRVVCVFRVGQQADPVILPVSHVDAEVGFQLLILAFSLPVCLRVERSAQAVFYLQVEAYV